MPRSAIRHPPSVPIYKETKRFFDARGWFSVVWSDSVAFDLAGSSPVFAQENLSRSTKGVVRGMHYQLPPSAQGKLVRVCRGRAFDAVVDMRDSSPTFGKWWGFDLDASTPHHLWVPVGFAHGFLALDDVTDLQYKVTAPYDPLAERSFLWNDPSVGIEWPLDGVLPVLSDKDAKAPLLHEADRFD